VLHQPFSLQLLTSHISPLGWSFTPTRTFLESRTRSKPVSNTAPCAGAAGPVHPACSSYSSLALPSGLRPVTTLSPWDKPGRSMRFHALPSVPGLCFLTSNIPAVDRVAAGRPPAGNRPLFMARALSSRAKRLQRHGCRGGVCIWAGREPLFIIRLPPRRRGEVQKRR